MRDQRGCGIRIYEGTSEGSDSPLVHVLLTILIVLLLEHLLVLELVRLEFLWIHDAVIFLRIRK